MVIFHTDHWGALAHFIVLAVNRHSEEECIIVVQGVDQARKDILERLEKVEIFSKVIVLEWEFQGAKLENQEEISQAVLKQYDQIFLANNVKIKNSDIFYTVTDIYGIFRYYLILKKIKYIHVMLSDKDIYEEYKKSEAYKRNDISKTFMDILNYNKVFDAMSPFCNKLIAFPDTEIKQIYLEKQIEVEKIDLSDELEKIDTDIVNKIVFAFNITKNKINLMTNLMLSNSQAFLRIPISLGGYCAENKLEHVLLYQMLIDFYADEPIERIIIKGHPNNFLDWRKYFIGAMILDKDIPIEFILLFKNIKLSKVIALETTAIKKIEKRIDNCILATSHFARYYHSLIKIYSICRLYVESKENLLLEETGIIKNFFESFINNVMDNHIKQWVLLDKSGWEGKFFRICYKPSICDMLNLSNVIQYMDTESVISLIDIPDNIPFCNWNQEYFSYLLVYQIRKQVLKNDMLLPMETEYILLFTKSKCKKEKLQKIVFEKKLQVTGVQLCISALSDFEREIWLSNYNVKNELLINKKNINYVSSYIKQNQFYICHTLCLIKDFEEYIYSLSLINNILIFIAVKDNAGRAYTYSAVKYIEQLGLKVKWNTIGWRGYLAIKNEDNVDVERLSNYGDKADYIGDKFSLKIELHSKPYKQGNSAEIIINGIDYAVNGRGINIVVYDKTIKKVVDSVCFDTFVEACTCTRKNS